MSEFLKSTRHETTESVVPPLGRCLDQQRTRFSFGCYLSSLSFSSCSPSGQHWTGDAADPAGYVVTSFSIAGIVKGPFTPVVALSQVLQGFRSSASW